MAKARLLAPLFSLLLGWNATGQAPPQSNTRYALRGSVVNSVSGEPIRKAMVEVGGQQSRHDFTGADGQFQFADLPGGSYLVAARRPGFMEPNGMFATVSAGSSTRSFQSGATVEIGPDTGTVVIKLVPLARVTGRVTDPEGEPIPNLNIQCLQQVIQAGHKRWQAVQTVSSDDGGNFLIDNLQPGKVLVATQQQQVYPGLMVDDRTSRLIYRKQYFPNSPDLASAQTIELNPGQDAQADLTVSTVKGTRVFFFVTPPQQWVFAMLSDAAGDQVQAEVRQNARDGGWMLPSVPPGGWRLIVNSNSGEQLSGEANIEVGDADVRNVVVPMSPPLQVPLSISGGGNTSGSPGSQVNVQLVPVGPSLNQGNYFGIGQGGNSITGVTPGPYHLSVSNSESGCVESMMSGATDLGRSEYVVTPGSPPPPINISLRTDCASLAISTTSGTFQLTQVVLSGGPNLLEPQLIYAGGGVSMKVSPGEYEVFAFSNVNSVEYANPEVLRTYTGQHVSLAPNQNATIRLESIDTSEHP